jgi:TolB-like protein
MNAHHEDEARRETRAYSPCAAEEGWVRLDSKDEDALARCEAVVLLGKVLADDADLKWAYDEAARIAAGPPRRTAAARARAAMANPVLAWSTAAVSTIVAIVSLVSSPHGSSSDAAHVPRPSGPELRASQAKSSPVNPTASAAAAAYSAVTLDAQSETTFASPPFASPVIVLPGRVFVDARSVAVMPFGVDTGASPAQPSPPARAVASDLYADVVEGLQSIPGVYVAQPVSVMPYVNTDLGRGEIAAQLGVRGIVEGRVAAADGRVRVTLSLTDAASDDVMWQGTIERPANAVADIGVDMVADVAAALANAGQASFDAASY